MEEEEIVQLIKAEAASRASGARGGRASRGGGLPPPNLPTSFFFFVFCVRIFGRADVFGAPFGVYFGASVLFIGLDRCARAYLLDLTVMQ